jgi:serine/threonine protein kinase
MDYCSGGDLDHLIKNKNNKLSEAEAFDVLSQTLNGL